jgi:hypothetical protein
MVEPRDVARSKQTLGAALESHVHPARLTKEGEKGVKGHLPASAAWQI